MLRVTIEMVPLGIEAGKREIGVMEIGFQGYINRDEHLARYCCKVTMDGEFTALDGIQHNRKDGALVLIKKCVEKYEEQ